MIAAIVPAKALDRAKGRLATMLSEEERRALALAMLEDVLTAVRNAPSVDSVTVVSPDDDVLKLASDLGATPVREPASTRGINQALDHALGQMSQQPDVLLVVLADVPEIEPGNIEDALSALPDGRGIVICPSADKGTSLLAMKPSGLIPFRFGPKSSVLHRREAAALHVPCESLLWPELTHDIDTPADLRDLASRPAETATHRLLARLDLASRTSA